MKKKIKEGLSNWRLDAISRGIVKQSQSCFIRVHTVNAGDYTKAQLAVWATGEPDLKQWDQSL